MFLLICSSLSSYQRVQQGLWVIHLFNSNPMHKRIYLKYGVLFTGDPVASEGAIFESDIFYGMNGVKTLQDNRGRFLPGNIGRQNIPDVPGGIFTVQTAVGNIQLE